MTHKIKQILTATLAILIVASISACTDNATNSSTSKTSSDTTSSVVDVESSVPETSVTDTSVPETTVHTEDTSVETPKPETTIQIATEVPETSSVPETEVPKPETTVTTTTTTVATTKPAPEWTETKVSGTKYVNTGCYSRKKAVLGADTVTVYNVNDKVTVTAKTDTGYFKLSDGSFIHSDYLSDSKVTVQTTTTTKTTSSSTPSSSGATYGSKEYVVNLCKQYGFVDIKATTNFANPMFVEKVYYDYDNAFTRVKNNADGKRVGYTLHYDSEYNIYGAWLNYELVGCEWDFTEQDCKNIIEQCYKWADKNGYKYKRVNEIPNYEKTYDLYPDGPYYDENDKWIGLCCNYGDVYKDSTWSHSFRTEGRYKDWSLRLTSKEEETNYLVTHMCNIIKYYNVEEKAVPCIDFTLFSEFVDYAQDRPGWSGCSSDVLKHDSTIEYIFIVALA